MVRLKIILSLVWVFLLAACDRSPSSNAPVVLAKKRVVQFNSVTQLPPGKNVQTAVDSLGNVFYVVESADQQDGVVVLSESGIPRATQLTSANILAVLGEKPGGSGAIQSIVPAPQGGLFFYFIGGQGKSVRACVGEFFTGSESIRILFGPDQLASQSGMGDSIGLARGSLLPTQSRIYLFLNHVDDWALFSFEARRYGPGVEPRLIRATSSIRADELGINVTQPQYELASGPVEDLLLIDKSIGSVWTVNPGNGVASPRMMLAGLPKEISTPVIVQHDHLLFFAADSELIQANMNDVLMSNLPQTTYPAMVDIGVDKKTKTIGRDDLRADGGFPVYTMRIHQLAPAPDGSFYGYDSSSGMLMKIRTIDE